MVSSGYTATKITNPRVGVRSLALTSIGANVSESSLLTSSRPLVHGLEPMPIGDLQLAKTCGLLQRGSGFADTVESRLLFSFFRAAHG